MTILSNFILRIMNVQKHDQKYDALCDHFQQFYNRRNVKVHVPIINIRWSLVTPVTESREYGNPIPSQNASLSNNYNITSAVHNCMCAFQFARRCYARTLRTADMLTLFCKLRKTKNFWRNSWKILGLPNARQKSYLGAQNQTRAYTRLKTHVRFESAAALFNVKCW